MKQTLVILSVIAVATAALLIVPSGCMTRKVTTVTQTTTGFDTNVVTEVNTNNLILESSALQAATAISVSIVVQKDPSVIPALKDAQTALDGVLNGSNPQTTQQVLETLKATGNPALTSEITSLMATASALEQNLLARYGAGVAGQISVALTRAANAGIIVGLAGH